MIAVACQIAPLQVEAWTYNSPGMTCASNAEFAGSAKPRAIPATNATAYTAATPKVCKFKERSAKATAAATETARVVAVGDMTAKQRQPERGNRFDQPENAQRQRAARLRVNLIADGDCQRPIRQGGTTRRAQPIAEFRQAQRSIRV